MRAPVFRAASAIILTLASNRVLAVDATPLAIDAKICIADAPFELPSKKFPIGCEILDCCPGCPGPGPIDVRLNFAAPSGSETRLSVGGVTKEALKTLKLGGNAKWADGGAISLAPGESSIRGWPSNAKQIPVFTPQVRFADTAIKELTRVGSKMAGPPLEATLSVTQFLDRFSVREYAVRYTMRACQRPAIPPRSTISAPPATDYIQLSGNTANDSAIVLLDARRSSGCVNDEVWQGNTLIDVGNVLSSNAGCTSSVAVFSDDNAVAFSKQVTVWRDAQGDVLSIPLQPVVREAVTYWVLWLREGFATTQELVNNDATRANQLFNEMNGGIGFNTTAINDVTAKATDELLIANCDKASALKNIGFTAGQLNVYYNEGSARGWLCDGDIVIVGSTADNESLAHEFGHALSLGHATFATTNLMTSGGTNRNTITIGQLFRTSTNNESCVNKHGLRPGGDTLNCPDATPSNACPALALDVIPR